VLHESKPTDIAYASFWLLLIGSVIYLLRSISRNTDNLIAALKNHDTYHSNGNGSHDSHGDLPNRAGSEEAKSLLCRDSSPR
jgi:hypothetical protein